MGLHCATLLGPVGEVELDPRAAHMIVPARLDVHRHLLLEANMTPAADARVDMDHSAAAASG